MNFTPHLVRPLVGRIGPTAIAALLLTVGMPLRAEYNSVVIRSIDGQRLGTGFLVKGARKCLILTADHVARNHFQFKYSRNAEEAHSADLVWSPRNIRGTSTDIAVLDTNVDIRDCESDPLPSTQKMRESVRDSNGYVLIRTDSGEQRRLKIEVSGTDHESIQLSPVDAVPLTAGTSGAAVILSGQPVAVFSGNTEKYATAVRIDNAVVQSRTLALLLGIGTETAVNPPNGQSIPDIASMNRIYDIEISGSGFSQDPQNRLSTATVRVPIRLVFELIYPKLGGSAQDDSLSNYLGYELNRIYKAIGNWSRYSIVERGLLEIAKGLELSELVIRKLSKAVDGNYYFYWEPTKKGDQVYRILQEDRSTGTLSSQIEALSTENQKLKEKIEHLKQNPRGPSMPAGTGQDVSSGRSADVLVRENQTQEIFDTGELLGVRYVGSSEVSGYVAGSPFGLSVAEKKAFSIGGKECILTLLEKTASTGKFRIICR